MKMSTLSSQFHLLKYPVKYPSYPSSNPNSFLIPISLPKHPQHPTILSSLPSEATSNSPPPTRASATKSKLYSVTLVRKESVNDASTPINSSGNNASRFWIMGAVSVGVMAALMAMDEQKAMALGPEGPLMEEFWDNVRRYGLYALTVSTGALYATFAPLYELLKNPISAVLVLVILGGGIFIFSQVLYAMVGVSDFSYDYGYINPWIPSM
ncbi:unnamed protein product [Malus baccata var. baccata]